MRPRVLDCGLRAGIDAFLLEGKEFELPPEQMQENRRKRCRPRRGVARLLGCKFVFFPLGHCRFEGRTWPVRVSGLGEQWRGYRMDSVGGVRVSRLRLRS